MSKENLTEDEVIQLFKDEGANGDIYGLLLSDNSSEAFPSAGNYYKDYYDREGDDFTKEDLKKVMRDNLESFAKYLDNIKDIISFYFNEHHLREPNYNDFKSILYILQENGVLFTSTGFYGRNGYQNIDDGLLKDTIEDYMKKEGLIKDNSNPLPKFRKVYSKAFNLEVRVPINRENKLYSNPKKKKYKYIDLSTKF